MVLMRSFFDASEAGPYFTVGGYLFRKSKVRPFEREWAQMLKRANPPLPYFRMSACNAGEKPFKDMDKPERDRVAREAISIISKYAVRGYFVGVKTAEFDAILGRESFVDNPYTLCLYLCLMGLKMWADENDPNARIGYWFEAGDTYQTDAEKFVTSISLSKRDLNFRYAGHAFVLKENSMPTQAADVLAWHSSKHLTRADQGLSKPRGDFGALLDGVETGYIWADAAVLNEFADISRKHAGDDPHLAKAAFRSDVKAFMKDPAAVGRFLERNGVKIDWTS